MSDKKLYLFSLDINDEIKCKCGCGYIGYRKYYFGKCDRIKYKSYNGSGKKWKRLVRKYGTININKSWFFFNTDDEACSFARKYSIDFNIVKCEKYCNLQLENGLDGNYK